MQSGSFSTPMLVRKWRQRPIWLVPMYYAWTSLVFGLILPRLEHAYGTRYASYLAGYGLSLSVTSTQALLSAVTSGMMALTAIVFSVAYITVQFNSIAYSPRLALMFARDPKLFHSFGIFIATFLYALITLAWVDRGGSGTVPLLSVLLVGVLVTISMFLFTRLVRGVSDMQVTNTLHSVGDRGRDVIQEMFNRLEEKGRPTKRTAPAQDVVPGPVTQSLRYHGKPRAIAELDAGALVRLAEAADGLIVMDCAVGDSLVDDSLLLRVHDGKHQIPERELMQAIDLRRERTFEQDPKYPIRLLVDIAIKALSAAVNDPTTAVQALDQIEDLLRRLARMELDAGYAYDAKGVLRLIFPMPSWEDYLRLSFDEIRRYGAGSVQVVRRLRSALAGIEESLTIEARITAVRQYTMQIDWSVTRSDLDPEDRAVASQQDRQGLGLSRKPAPPKPVAAEPLQPVKAAGAT